MLKAIAPTAILFLALCGATLGVEVRIASAKDLISFSAKVNSGESYNGTTVVLEADIEFTNELSEQFDPIGTSVKSTFKGTLDGQGYTISNLAMKTTGGYCGLIGYSAGGVTVRNVVIDDTCSFESTNSLYVYIGPIAGFSSGTNGNFTVENCVNMASISFSGKVSSYAYLGGIVGRITALTSSAYILNCANYGDITNLGTVKNKNSYLGGIVGEVKRRKSTELQIMNSANYGNITMNGINEPCRYDNDNNLTNKNCLHGAANESYIGGIVGSSIYSDIRNCLNAGNISTNKNASFEYIGTIAGSAIGLNVERCYCTSTFGGYNALGVDYDDAPSAQLEKDSQNILTKMNDYASENSWSKWIRITDAATVSFKANDDGKALSFTSEIAIVPEFASVGRDFEGWFYDDDSEFTETSISTNTELHGKWAPKSFVMSFNFTNGTVVNETYPYNGDVTYPECYDTEDEIYFGWDRHISKMLGEDTVVYAQWTPVSDTVIATFGTTDLIQKDLKRISGELLNGGTGNSFDVEQYVISSEGTIAATVKFDGTTDSVNYFRAAMNNMETYNIVDVKFKLTA